MRKTQGGFTLIELVVVIVLLGILGVTALGRFQDLSGDALNAAVTGVASEVSASAAVNYAQSLVNAGGPAVNINGTAGADITANASANACDTANAVLGTLFQTGVFPARFTTVSNTAANCTGAGVTFDCTIYSDDDNDNTLDAGEASAVATLICTGGA